MKRIHISAVVMLCLLILSCSQKADEQKEKAYLEQVQNENKKYLKYINDSTVDANLFKKYPLLQKDIAKDFSFEYQQSPQDIFFLLEYVNVVDVFINNSQMYIKISDGALFFNLKLDTLKFPIQKLTDSDLLVVKAKYSHTSNFKYDASVRGESCTIDTDHDNTFFFDGEILEYTNYKRNDD